MSNKSSLVPFLTSDEDQNLHVKMVKNVGKPGLNCTEGGKGKGGGEGQGQGRGARAREGGKGKGGGQGKGRGARATEGAWGGEGTL